ncbi:zinc binding dehydrogenase [Thecamonas trahens ATCC 50062]|uniref:Zinc binding dehydrogenase n=1 Tax=Thecamonas trahens ATCC 50062 TaxID=461836 RepID=A0A0L0D6F3_THETB|nr:zinc binding dehydrogenase [Thecamonas trahens ATCC 50062]KNC47962.1 zinc binding dehydrogenase [Thecamonas trahens ATCC 50062]|eukprot:XP_013758979.1 zinc binding dehydrogenase [Thecamonas trahens ATCC 50062]
MRTVRSIAPTGLRGLRLVRTPRPPTPPASALALRPLVVGLNAFDARRLDGYAGNLLAVARSARSLSAPGLASGDASASAHAHVPGREGVALAAPSPSSLSSPAAAPAQRLAFALPVAWPGALAEDIVVPVACAAPVPSSVDTLTAAALPYAGLTALAAVDEVTRVGAGDAVVVAGASGPVGVLAVQLAQLRGSDSVVAVASRASLDAVAPLLGDVTLLAYDEPSDAAAIDDAIAASHVTINAAAADEDRYLAAMGRGSSAQLPPRASGRARAYATLNGPLPRLTDEGGVAIGGALAAFDLAASKLAARAAGFDYDWVLFHPSGPGLASLLDSVATGQLTPLPHTTDSLFTFGPFESIPDASPTESPPSASSAERAALDAVVAAFRTLDASTGSGPGKTLITFERERA